MICNDLTAALGFDCSPLSADGSIALVYTPFRFKDGDEMPVFVEVVGEQIRFFDDGHVVMHFLGRGLRFDDGRQTRFIKTAASAHGATFTEAGELEVWSHVSDAGSGFAKFVGSLMGIAAWERDQEGVSVDTTLFVEEVAMALMASSPKTKLSRAPEFTGVSGRRYELDLMFGDTCVVATSPHPIAVGSVLHKLVDIRGVMDNASRKLLVVIDDRVDHEAADREAKIMQSVADVQPFTALIGKKLWHPRALQ